MNLPKGKPTLWVFFFLGIVLPSIVLTFLSFRSIRNEFYVAKKSYEDDCIIFNKQIEEKIEQEFTKVLEEVRANSIWLLDQPRNIDELSKPMPFDSIPGIKALFLFDAQGKVHPKFTPKKQFKLPPQNIEVDSFDISLNRENNLNREYLLRLLRSGVHLSEEKHINNLLGILRIHYQKENWGQCLAIINSLQRKNNLTGIFNSSLHISLQLMRFNILVKTNNLDQALNFAQTLIEELLESPEINHLEDVLFAFDSILNTVLSFESLSADKRESLWYIHKNLLFLLKNAIAWNTYEELLLRLKVNPYPSTDGIMVLAQENLWGFKLNHPWLQGTQELVGVINPQSLNKRILSAVKPLTREWKEIYFKLYDANDKVLFSSLSGDSLNIQQETLLLANQLNWSLQIFERDHKELRQQSRKKMFLLYSLVFFSLVVIVLGGVAFGRSLTQERSLLSMKSNFLSSISHELKTPLTSIKMFAEMMAQGRIANKEKVSEYAELIGKEATRLEDLIQAILDYTRMEREDVVLQKKSLNLSKMVEDICEKVKTIAHQKGLRFYMELTPNILFEGDYSSLHSLVQKLIENAIKYTPAPGNVWVKLIVSEDFYILKIKDTGIGIDVSEQSKIFNDFYRVGDEMTRSTKGSGLGLAIARKAAEAHQANINIQSILGKGSTFTVQFKKVNNDL
ncbi:MAG: hypothetical protein GX801_08835 [Fibrobacter sp.]|nr:hypothetical protein [Fibrobacter sp.]